MIPCLENHKYIMLSQVSPGQHWQVLISQARWLPAVMWLRYKMICQNKISWDTSSIYLIPLRNKHKKFRLVIRLTFTLKSAIILCEIYSIQFQWSWISHSNMQQLFQMILSTHPYIFTIAQHCNSVCIISQSMAIPVTAEWNTPPSYPYNLQPLTFLSTSSTYSPSSFITPLTQVETRNIM